MDLKQLFVLAAVASSLIQIPAPGGVLDLGFEPHWYPREYLMGPSGAVKTIDVDISLTTNLAAKITEGWSLSMEITGGTIQSISNLYSGTTSVAELAVHKDDPTRHGAISKVVLQEPFPPISYMRIVKIVIQVTVPTTADGNEVVLRFVDGFVGTGEPVRNLVLLSGSSYVPALEELRFKVFKYPSFLLGFDGAPTGTLEGMPGEVKTLEIFPTLATLENGSPEGVEGWTLSIEVVGAELDSILLNGVIVDTIYDEDDDGDPSTPAIHHDHYLTDLSDSRTVFTHIAAKASGAPPSPLNNPNRKGAISAVVLGVQAYMVLQPTGTQRIARLVIKATVPRDDSEQEVVLRYIDGMRSSVSQPVRNLVTFVGSSRTPEFQESRFKLLKYPWATLGFGFGFEGFPSGPVEGQPGDVKTFEIYPTLTTFGNQGPAGPSSWAFSLGITGGMIRSIDLGGIQVYTIFDNDGDPATPPLDPYPFELAGAWQKDAELAVHGDDRSREGAISMVVLSGTDTMTLQPNGTQRIARLVVEAEFPEDDVSREVVLRFEDGFRSTGLPRKNWINIDDVYASPILGECRFTLLKGITELQVPGDFNQSGGLEISDAISLLAALFQFTPGLYFPCGNRLPSDPGNIVLLDWQPDGGVDISDGIAILQFLFLGGSSHPRAVPWNPINGCVPIYHCPNNPRLRCW